MRTKSSEECIGSLTNDREGTFNFFCDLCSSDRSNILNAPDLNVLPIRHNPILAKLKVFRFHENQNIARAYQR